MSAQLISRSPDLKRLKEEGYDVEIRHGYLLVRHVPYVNKEKHVLLGILVCPLTLAGDVTAKPENHEAMFQGEFPCRMDGREITTLGTPSGAKETIAPGLTINQRFSNRPADGYKDFYEKMTTYIAIISGPARAIDSSATATINVFREVTEEDSVFHYIDNASSTDGIAALNAKLALDRIAIIGLGGCGSYVLDLVAKTPVKEIHIFDGDPFLQHNAFRAPGAPSKDELRTIPVKVAYFAAMYGKMHKHVTPHDFYIDTDNVDGLRDMSFVFLCLDRGASKKVIVDKLREWNTPFIDIGMDVAQSPEGLLGGMLRVTTISKEKNDHVAQCVPFSDANPNEDYSKNVQIADLNALCATLAVIKWKKLYGIYHDFKREHQSLYTIDVNTMISTQLNETS